MWYLLGLIPLFWLLWHTGILSGKAASVSIGSCRGTPSRWRGRYKLLSGRLSRRFLVPSSVHTLLIETEVDAGALAVEVRGPAGEPLYTPQSAGSFSARVNVGGIRRCSLRITASQFKGRFDISLQP